MLFSLQTLDICHISSADVDQDVTFHGRWEVGLNAGGVQKGDFKSFAKNPQVRWRSRMFDIATIIYNIQPFSFKNIITFIYFSVLFG